MAHLLGYARISTGDQHPDLAGWRLLWTERLRRDLAPIYQFVACRRGRHHDAQVMVDELVGSDLGDAYPEAAICEVCGRAVDWPNGTPTLQPVATPPRP